MKIKSVIGALILMAAASVQADPVDLFEACVSVDGVVSNVGSGDSLCNDSSTTEANVDDSGFTGNANVPGFSQTVSVTVTGAGTHNVSMYADWDLNEISGGGFISEFGGTGGALGAGQSWQLDEWFDGGSIYTNFLAQALANTNGVPVGDASTDPASLCCDVTAALSWIFDLVADEIATVAFTVTDNIQEAMAAGFYLIQTDVWTETEIYFYSTLQIRRPGTAVPEPGTLLLLGTGLLALGLRRRATMRKQ